MASWFLPITHYITESYIVYLVLTWTLKEEQDAETPRETIEELCVVLLHHAVLFLQQ